jgi:hypothetical protein
VSFSEDVKKTVDLSYNMMLIVAVRHSSNSISKEEVKVKETLPFNANR